MSDKQSQKSSATNKTSRHKIKICGYCGKGEGPNYQRHNDEKHSGQVPLIWNPDEDLKETSWCTNWKEMIEDPKATAIEKLASYERGFGSLKGIENRSQAGSTKGKSVKAGVSMNIEEEKKDEPVVS